MEDFEDSLDLTFNNQWDSNIRNEAFPLNQYFVSCFWGVLEVCDVTSLLPDQYLPGEPLSQPDLWTCW